jgi:ubiquinone/menaquinone biosynthesis C-methylase UbiE
MRSLDFADHSFDGLLVAYSLIHIPSVEIPKTLTGFNRVLKPGGYIEIIAQKGKTDIIIDEPFMPSEKMFFNFFSKEKLKKFLEEAGFEIEYQREAKSPDPEVGSDTIIYTIAKKKLGYDLYLADQIDRNNLPSIDVEISKSREIS